MTQEEFHKRFQYNSNTDCLGEGGFGKVYKAYDTHRDRYVAIKMAEVKPHLEEVRLKKEVEIISKLPSHPNIAYYEDCYTFSTFAGEYDFGVLQYYEEGNLQQLLADKQLSYEQKDSLLKQILEGIIFLHSQGIIHRDIKPQNILISNRNGKYIPKITDFGISKKLDVNKSTFFTNSLAGAGTLSFSSPEQLLGNTIRKNTDLWSFGVIACWLFTGNLPFNTGNQTVTSEAGRIELFKQITSGDITSILQQLPSAWQMLVKQCIVVDNERRINSASECLDFFENKLSGEIKIELKTEKSETTSNTTIDNKLNTTSVSINDQYKSRKNRIKVSASSITIKRLIFITLSVLAVIVIISIATSSPMKINKEIVTDIDGNIYHTITIGNQTWMIENLNTTRYTNGEQIPFVDNENQWINFKQGAFCYCNNSPSYTAEYGRLYNWYAVVDNRKIAPVGWHVATEADYTILIKNYDDNGYNHDLAKTENIFTRILGSVSNWFISFYTGKIGKDRTTSNGYNFTRGAQDRLAPRPEIDIYKPETYKLGRGGAWWCSSPNLLGYGGQTDIAKGRIYWGPRSFLQSDGLSVRCVKDN